jgi:hypothetical protein
MPDGRNSRLLIIGPDGKPVRTVAPSQTSTSGPGGGQRIMGGGATGARFVDARGRLYYQSAVYNMNAHGPSELPDSAPLVRYDLRTSRGDTIAYVKLPPRGPTTTRSAGTNMTVMMSGPRPFAVANDWNVLPDGSIVIAHAADYHLEVIRPDGQRVAGPPVPYTPIRVNEAEKKAYRDAMATAPRGTITINGRSSPAPLPPEPDEWPETKPAFAINAMSIAPNGEVWLLRSRPAADEIPTMDVFNAQARLVGRVTLPKGTRLIGFGARSAYLIRTDEDGLQYLSRYAIP